VDAELADAFADRLDVAWIAERQSINPSRNLGLCRRIREPGEPFRKDARLTN
jgi:hypothetical protein